MKSTTLEQIPEIYRAAFKAVGNRAQLKKPSKKDQARIDAREAIAKNYAWYEKIDPDLIAYLNIKEYKNKVVLDFKAFNCNTDPKKLFKKLFEIVPTEKDIYIYADRRWIPSNNIFTKSGFTIDSIKEPVKYYFTLSGNDIKMTRSKPEASEVSNEDLYIIYDSGHLVLKYSN